MSTRGTSPGGGRNARQELHLRTTGIGRPLILVGLALIVAGCVAILLERLNLPLGRLPGDLSWRGRNWSVSFPVVTCLVVSVVLSLLMWIVNRFRG